MMAALSLDSRRTLPVPAQALGRMLSVLCFQGNSLSQRNLGSNRVGDQFQVKLAGDKAAASILDAGNAVVTKEPDSSILLDKPNGKSDHRCISRSLIPTASRFRSI